MVQEQLGHASIETTTIYAKVTKEDKLQAANVLAKTSHDSPRTGEGGEGIPGRAFNPDSFDT